MKRATPIRCSKNRVVLYPKFSFIRIRYAFKEGFPKLGMDGVLKGNGGDLDIDPNLFFLPPARRGLRGHQNNAFQSASHRRRRGSAFSVKVVK